MSAALCGHAGRTGVACTEPAGHALCGIGHSARFLDNGTYMTLVWPATPRRAGRVRLCDCFTNGTVEAPGAPCEAPATRGLRSYPDDGSVSVDTGLVACDAHAAEWEATGGDSIKRADLGGGSGAR